MYCHLNAHPPLWFPCLELCCLHASKTPRANKHFLAFATDILLILVQRRDYHQPCTRPQPSWPCNWAAHDPNEPTACMGSIRQLAVAVGALLISAAAFRPGSCQPGQLQQPGASNQTIINSGLWPPSQAVWSLYGKLQVGWGEMRPTLEGPSVPAAFSRTPLTSLGRLSWQCHHWQWANRVCSQCCTARFWLCIQQRSLVVWSVCVLMYIT